MHFPWSSSVVAPTYSISSSSVQPTQNPSLSFWVHCTGEYSLLIIGLTGDSKMSLSCLFWLDFFTVSSILCPYHRRGGPSGLATPIFSLSSLEPKSLRMVILTIILVQVLCVSSIAKTLYWNMAWEAIFATIYYWCNNQILCCSVFKFMVHYLHIFWQNNRNSPSTSIQGSVSSLIFQKVH